MKKSLAILTFLPTLVFGQWTQIGNGINGEAEGDNLRNVSLSADGLRVAVSSYNNAGSGTDPGAGHTRVFENVNGTWVQLGADIDGDYGDQSGQYVSLSPDGSTFAVGEPISAINGALAGQVRVFRYLNNTWTQLGNSIQGDSFNWQTGSVSLSQDGSILAVGARGADVQGLGGFSGKVRIYEFQSGNWIQIGNDINAFGAADFFGYSISLSSDGSIVAIGAIGNPFDGDIGYVSVFENISGNWTQVGANINGTTPAGEFGYDVSISADGSVVATSERNDASMLGAVQVFSNQNGVWTQIGDTLFGQSIEAQFGFSVSLSANGNKLAVGSFNDDSNGDNAGSVFIFENQGGNWVQLGNSILGELGEGFGLDVSLSATGSIVAASAPGNGDNGSAAGQVRIFENLVASSVGDFVPERLLNIYPIPATDFLTIKSENEINTIELYSLLGELILDKKSTDQKEIKLNVSALSSGTYTLKLKTNDRMFYKKVIKQ